MDDDPHLDADWPRVLISNRQDEPSTRRGCARSPATRCAARGSSARSSRCRSSTQDEIAELHERFMDEPGPTDVLSFPLDDVDDETASGSSATSSWRPRRRRGTTRPIPRPSSGSCSSTGSCISSATTTRRTARAPGCGSGRSATAGCARRELVVGARGRARALRVGARRRRGVAHADVARSRAGARGGRPPERGDARQDRVRSAALPERRLPLGDVRAERLGDPRGDPRGARVREHVGHARVVRVHAAVLRVRRGDGEDVRGPAHGPRGPRALAARVVPRPPPRGPRRGS